MYKKNIEKLQALNIGVLCGGVGTEVEVSLDSGHAITSALKKNGLSAHKVVVDGSQEQILNLDNDLVFIALHGEFGEDGTVQRLLERKRIPFTGSGAQASKLCMDKNLTKIMMQRISVPVAPWVCVNNTDKVYEKLNNNGIEFPVVVKPNSGGSSVGVIIVDREHELPGAVEAILELDDSVMIEAFVGGIEFTSAVLDGVALPIVELKAEEEFYDYHAKYKSDTTQYECPPVNISSDVQAVCSDLSVDIYRNFKLRDMARVDYILGDNGTLIALEVNSIPGFTSHSLLPKAAKVKGICFDELCLKIVNMAYIRGKS